MVQICSIIVYKLSITWDSVVVITGENSCYLTEHYLGRQGGSNDAHDNEYHQYYAGHYEDVTNGQNDEYWAFYLSNVHYVTPKTNYTSSNYLKVNNNNIPISIGAVFVGSS